MGDTMSAGRERWERGKVRRHGRPPARRRTPMLPLPIHTLITILHILTIRMTIRMTIRRWRRRRRNRLQKLLQEPQHRDQCSHRVPCRRWRAREGEVNNGICIRGRARGQDAFPTAPVSNLCPPINPATLKLVQVLFGHPQLGDTGERSKVVTLDAYIVPRRIGSWVEWAIWVARPCLDSPRASEHRRRQSYGCVGGNRDIVGIP